MSKVHVIGNGDLSLRLDAALLLYRSHAGDVYATAHPIERDPKSPKRHILGPGIPATTETLAGFAQAIGEATAYSGFVPTNLLYTTPNVLAWWTPAAIRRTWFRAISEGIGNTSGPAAHPALVFIATPGDWFVFALKENSRPDPDTRLCHAPHFNVWDRGRICTGNATLPPTIGADSIAAYEEAFFRSNFTHPNRGDAVKYKGGMPALWRDQLARPDLDVMTAALMRSKETLRSAIERITTSLR